jgi:hypothetical protein
MIPACVVARTRHDTVQGMLRLTARSCDGECIAPTWITDLVDGMSETGSFGHSLQGGIHGDPDSKSVIHVIYADPEHDLAASPPAY